MAESDLEAVEVRVLEKVEAMVNNEMEKSSVTAPAAPLDALTRNLRTKETAELYEE